MTEEEYYYSLEQLYTKGNDNVARTIIQDTEEFELP
jgi:hypothetical protein